MAAQNCVFKVLKAKSQQIEMNAEDCFAVLKKFPRQNYLQTGQLVFVLYAASFSLSSSYD